MLAFLLAREESPEVVHVRAKDHGLDARLPSVQGATLRGWQSKRFLERIHWDQCRASVARAIAFWRPLRITFVFPKVLSAKEQEEFRTELIEAFPRIRLDWWDASELQPRMRNSDGGRHAAEWLFGNPEADKQALQRVIAVGGELSDAGHAAARVAEVQRFMSRDPHLRYTTISRENTAPETPPAKETLASFEADFGDLHVRFDASERYPGAASHAGLGGTFAFSHDAAGQRAREAVMRVIAGGGRAEISSGMTADFGPVPLGFRGLVPAEPITGEFHITSTGTKRPTPPRRLPVLVRAGSAELGMVLSPIDAQPGWDRTAAGSAGGLDIFMSFRGAQGTGESRMDWRWNRGQGNALEQLLAAEVMLAAHKDPVELVSPVDGTVMARGTTDPREGSNDELGALENARSFLEYAVQAEGWLGVPLTPPVRPSENDAQILAWLVAQIRRPEREGSLKRLQFVLSRAVEDIEAPFQALLLQPLSAELFGDDRYLGLQQIHVPEARFDGVNGTEQPGDTVAIVPVDPEAKVAIRLYSPIVAPPGAVGPEDCEGDSRDPS